MRSDLELNALASEYKGYYGDVRGQVELRDIVNYPPLARQFRSQGLRLPEETLNLVLGDRGPVHDDPADALLISKDAIESFSE